MLPCTLWPQYCYCELYRIVCVIFAVKKIWQVFIYTKILLTSAIQYVFIRTICRNFLSEICKTKIFLIKNKQTTVLSSIVVRELVE